MELYRRRLREAMTDFRRHWVRSLFQVGLWWLAFFVFSSALWIRRKFGAPFIQPIPVPCGVGISWPPERRILYHQEFCRLLFCSFQASSAAVSSSVRKKLIVRRAHRLPDCCPTAFLLNEVSFFAYAENRSGPDYFSTHYGEPAQVELKGKKPHGIWSFIYVESLDAAYSDPNLFGRNLLHGLDAPAIGGVSFDRYSQAPGTGWTIAGIASTQCGVPLEPVTFYDRNTQGEKIKHFLPGAVCLGDVLSSFGYRNVFMQGAPLSFSGKGQFLKDHHYAEQYGRDEWIAQGERTEDMSGWGLAR